MKSTITPIPGEPGAYRTNRIQSEAERLRLAMCAMYEIGKKGDAACADSNAIMEGCEAFVSRLIEQGRMQAKAERVQP